MLQDWLDASVNSNRVTTLPGRLYAEVEADLVMPHRGVLRGQGPFQTVIRAESGETGALITSVNYSDLASSPNNQFRFQTPAIPTGIIFEDVGFHGSGLNTNDWDSGDALTQAYDLTALKLFTAGLRVHRCRFYHINGTAIDIDRGDNPGALTGVYAFDDSETNRLDDVYVFGALTGILVRGGADFEMSDIQVAAVRDRGLDLQAAAGVIDNVHVWNVQTDDTTDEDPSTSDGDEDKGVGIMAGNSAGNSGQLYFTGITQVDNCRVGARFRVGSTSVEKFIGKFCDEIACHVTARTHFDHIQVTNMDASSVGVRIDTGGPFTNIDELDLTLTSNCKGIIVLADNVTIKGGACWGGAANVVTMIEFGSATVAPNGCMIGPIFINGCGDNNAGNGQTAKAILINNLGKGNTILIAHKNQVDISVTLPSGYGATNTDENTVKSLNTETGVLTIHTDDVTGAWP